VLLTTGIFATTVIDTGQPGEFHTVLFEPSKADWQPVTHEVVIARWKSDDPEPDVSLILSVAFDEPEVPDMQPVLAVLSNIRGLVEWVLWTAEREIPWV